MSASDYFGKFAGPVQRVELALSEFYVRHGKRALDLVLAVLVLPLLVPFIGVLWLLVARDGGNGFLGHSRVGQNGSVFKCWKLRTMVVDSQQRLRLLLATNPDAAAEWARSKVARRPPHHSVRAVLALH